MYVYTYIGGGILFSHKKGKILPFSATQMKLEGTGLSEISKADKDTYCMISFICEILKNHTHRNKEHIGGYQGVRDR